MPAAGLDDVHVPPLPVLVRADVLPTHTFRPPPIAPGAAFTVTVATAQQPVAPII